MAKIFISYARKNLEKVSEIVTDIKRFVSEEDIWMDLSGIPSDSPVYQNEIIKAIGTSEIVLFMLSKESQESPNTKKELAFARRRGKRIILIRIDSAPLEDWFEFELINANIIHYDKDAERSKLLNELGAEKLQNQKSDNQTNIIDIQKLHEIKSTVKRADENSRKEIKRRAIFIGLGGAGVDTLLLLKKQFIEDCDVVPGLCSFLALDNDRHYLDKVIQSDIGEVALSNPEKLFLNVIQPLEVYNCYKEKFSWMTSEDVKALAHLKSFGTGMFRTNARFVSQYNEDYIIKKIHDIYNEINTIQNLQIGTISDHIDIYVVCSIGGGFGSGIFVSIANLIKSIIPQSRIHLLALLPSVYKGSINELSMDRFEQNAYSAICELDMIMSTEFHDKRILWQNREGGKSQLQMHLFDRCFFIDNELVDHKYIFDINDLYSKIAKFIYYRLYAEEAEDAAVVFTKFSGENNVNNKYAWAETIGICEARINKAKLEKHVSSLICAELLRMHTRNNHNLIYKDFIERIHLESMASEIGGFYNQQNSNTLPQNLFSQAENHIMTNVIQSYIVRNGIRLESDLSDDLIKNFIDITNRSVLSETSFFESVESIDQVSQTIYSLLNECNHKVATLDDRLLACLNDIQTMCRDLEHRNRSIFYRHLHGGELGIMANTIIGMCNNYYALRNDIEKYKTIARTYRILQEEVEKQKDKIMNAIVVIDSVCHEVVSARELKNNDYKTELDAIPYDKINAMIPALSIATEVKAKIKEKVIANKYMINSDEVIYTIRKQVIDCIPESVYLFKEALSQMREAYSRSTLLSSFDGKGWLVPDYKRINNLFVYASDYDFSSIVEDQVQTRIVRIPFKDRVVFVNNSNPLPPFAIKSISTLAEKYKGEILRPIDQDLYKMMREEHYSIFPLSNV